MRLLGGAIGSAAILLRTRRAEELAPAGAVPGRLGHRDFARKYPLVELMGRIKSSTVLVILVLKLVFQFWRSEEDSMRRLAPEALLICT